MSSNTEPSFVQLLQDIVASIERLLRSELRLVKTELKEEVSKGARGGAVMGAGLLLGFYSIGLFLLAAVYALSQRLPLWSAALFVALFAAIVASVLIVTGRHRLTQVHLKPEKAIEAV